ncbi:MAG: zinc ribbon domain-containing protein [Planctomycetota bacterium]|jgi:hypothetical protein
MTTRFNCPSCNALIAFADKHRGKRARCTTCGQRFIIPFQSSETPKKIRPPREKGEPLPGFYRAVFVESKKLFTTAENVTGLVFIITAVCFKFFVARMNYTVTIPGQWLVFEFPLPIGLVLNASAWGFLFWYYMEVIYSTAFEAEELPEVIVGGISGFVWRIVKSIYTFFIILLVVELPFIVVSVISSRMGIDWPVLVRVLMLGGLFFFPMAILTVAVGRDLTMLRPDYLLIPICRAVKPYLVTAALLGAAGVLQMRASQYAGQAFAVAAGHLLLNLAVQVVALIAMRSVGLFYRHYGCHFPW